MGFQARKSFKVMPGVRMTVSRAGVSTSVGTKGARVTRTASGRVTRTVGIPGSGLSHTKTVSGGSRAAVNRSPAPQPPPAPAKPGLTAPKWEKALYRIVMSGDYAQLESVAREHPEAAPLVASLDGLMLMSQGQPDRALQALRYAWTNAGPIEQHPFVRRYLTGSVSIQVADGVTAALPLSRDAVGLALAELEQEAGNLDAAVDVVEALDPSVVAAVSLCELYTQRGDHAEVVSVTNGLQNEDDPTALLLTFRGTALRELGQAEAALETFREALKSKARDPAIRHLALVERARTLHATGKVAMARKDLGKVMAENARYPGIEELLASMQ